MIKENTINAALLHWAKSECALDIKSIAAMPSGAGTRRYFRAQINGQHTPYVIADMSQDLASCARFLDLWHRYNHACVRVPRIIAANEAIGYVCMEDFGDRQIFHQLRQPHSLEKSYDQALELLPCIQSIQAHDLPLFDEAFYWREFDVFERFYLEDFCEAPLEAADRRRWRTLYAELISCAIEQPQVVVHRDYHSQNLMICDDGTIGVLDFQDTSMGPMTYDVVSLLKDCYVSHSAEHIHSWAMAYYHNHVSHSHQLSENDFLRLFHHMGLQRHLKALGTFARAFAHGDSRFLCAIQQTQTYIASFMSNGQIFQSSTPWINPWITAKLPNKPLS